MYNSGDEFPCRLCDPLPPVTAVLYYRLLAESLHDKMISQGVGGHRVHVGIRHPYNYVAKFEEHCFHISKDILYSVLCHFSCK